MRLDAFNIIGQTKSLQTKAGWSVLHNEYAHGPADKGISVLQDLQLCCNSNGKKKVLIDREGGRRVECNDYWRCVYESKVKKK